MRSSSEQSSLPNRWVVAITAFIMQLALGSVYAWSIFLISVIASYHVSRLQANPTFGIIGGIGFGLGYIGAQAMWLKQMPLIARFVSQDSVAAEGVSSPERDTFYARAYTAP
jgi:hypothetical protein